MSRGFVCSRSNWDEVNSGFFLEVKKLATYRPEKMKTLGEKREPRRRQGGK